MILDRVAESVVLLWGWRRWGAAFLAGTVSALAMAPFGLWPVLALTFPVAVWLLDGSEAAGSRAAGLRAAAAIGWWFGFGYFLAGLWWVGSAFLVQAEVFGWLLPFAVLALPAGLALFPALGFAIAWALWIPGPWRILAFTLGLGIAELLRGIVLTGFPWNAFGYALADQAWLGQAASLVGVEGLTFLAIFIFSSPASLAASPDRSIGPTVASAAMLCTLALFGAVRLGGADLAQRPETVRIVQPRVSQDAKFRPEAGPEILSTYLSMSDLATAPGRGGLNDATLLLWPESAFPFLLTRSPTALAEIGAALPETTTLLTGAARGEDAADGALRIFNSIHAIGHGGTIHTTYDKVHLVPFGEYLPFQSLLESIGLRQLTRLRGGFAAGDAHRDMMLPSGLRLRPLICYEAIFPSESAGEERPDALLNLTNDGWFGQTPGPYQHFAMARARTIEQGLPMLRAANTGISAIVDPYGRIVRSLGLGERSVLDGNLPPGLQPTIYARLGRTTTLVLVLVILISYAAARSFV